MKISIQPATPADSAVLVDLQIAAFHHDAVIYPGVEVGGPPGYDSLEVTRQKINEAECYTIKAGERCIGGIVMIVMPQAHVHLDLIFIDPSYHNRGIGSQAMQYIERMHPVSRWTLDTPQWATRNIHFYEKLGYVKVGEHEYDGTPLFAFEKRSSKPEAT